MIKNHINRQQVHRGSFIYIVTAISALGGLLFGYDTGVISGAILFIKKRFMLSATLEEFVVSFVLVGAVIGAVVGGRLADRFGRRRVIIVASALFACGSLGTALALSVAWLVAGRFVVGVAIGIASFATPLYISEISPEDIRGKLVSFNQLAITIGIVVSYLIGYALSSSGNWRLMFGLAAIPSSILGIGMFFMPSSPRWLVSRAMMDKARTVLEQIRGTSDVDEELRGIQEGLAQQSGNWKALAGPLLRPALIVGIGLAVLQQITGINTVIYYAPTIFQFAGFQSASTAILATVGVGVINMVITIVAMQLLDRVGRRPLLLIGLAGMIFSLGMLGFAFQLPNLSKAMGWVAVGSLMLYVGSFAIGMGPVFWLLISEIYPLKIRGLAMSIATVANWGANFIVALTFLSMIKILGRSGTFWVYALVGIVAWLFSYFLVPETRGRSLEYIESHWRSGGHPRQMGKK
ncbi:MAG TPA: sugar porter family MFS transporter [Nitrospirae bacterium]|nr:sugar porter family MFS transporter [Nitrospirota bacterium]